MKRTIKDCLKVLLLLLDEIAVVVLVLLVLRVLGISIPLPFTIVAALVLGALVFIMHKAVIPSFHKKEVTGSEGMIGCDGEVIERLNPVGVIRVGSEYWQAKSVNENIAIGEEVEIIELKGLRLMVKLKKTE
ncbi:NfeD family protein [Chloroflexota bacterium]